MASAWRDPSADHFNLGTQERMFANRLVSQLQGVVGASNAALRAFTLPPGRNVMLLLAGGWPMEVDQFVARDPRRVLNQRVTLSGLHKLGIAWCATWRRSLRR